MNLDMMQPGQYALALLPEVVLSVWAMLVLLVDVFQKGDRPDPSRPSITLLTGIGVLLALAANTWLLTVHGNGEGVVALDGFRVFTNYVFLLAVAFFLLISGRYLSQEHLRLGELYVLVLFATVGMMIFSGTTDLMLDVHRAGADVRAGVRAHGREPSRCALGGRCAQVFPAGRVLQRILPAGRGARVRCDRHDQPGAIALAAGVDGTGRESRCSIIGVVMLAVGFGFKVAAVPFHMWTPDAYEGAPAPVTGFMAAAVKAAAFAAFLRVFLTAFPGLYDTWDAIAVWLAVITMVVANLVALVEGNIKRMLAYSSIAHAGYLLVALAAGSALGAASFLFYALVYTIMTMGAFAVVIAVAGMHEARLDLESYSGLGWRQPLLAAAMTVFLLSLAGFPFTAGFIGKVFLLRAAVERGLVLLAVVLVMASLLSYWYYLRVAWYMWFREPGDDQPAMAPLSTGLRVGVAVAAVAVIALGIFPGSVLAAAERSAASSAARSGRFLRIPVSLTRRSAHASWHRACVFDDHRGAPPHSAKPHDTGGGAWR